MNSALLKGFARAVANFLDFFVVDFVANFFEPDMARPTSRPELFILANSLQTGLGLFFRTQGWKGSILGLA